MRMIFIVFQNEVYKLNTKKTILEHHVVQNLPFATFSLHLQHAISGIRILVSLSGGENSSGNMKFKILLVKISNTWSVVRLGSLPSMTSVARVGYILLKTVLRHSKTF